MTVEEVIELCLKKTKITSICLIQLGIFNWDLLYRRFPRRPEDQFKLDNPIPSPLMVNFKTLQINFDTFL